jgi:hypothetical protein
MLRRVALVRTVVSEELSESIIKETPPEKSQILDSINWLNFIAEE